jgi:hypothetical protein
MLRILQNAHDVSEEDVSARMDFDIIQRIKLPAEEIVKEHGCIVRWIWINKRNGRWQGTAARINQKQIPTKRTCTPVRHLDTRREVELSNA